MDGPFLTPSGRARGKRRRWKVVLGVALTCVAVLVAAGAGVWLLVHNEIPARTSVGGIAIGGLSESQARATISAAAGERVGRPIDLVTPSAEELTTTGEALGATPKIEQALRAAASPGIMSRVVRRLGLGGERAIPLRYGLDRIAFKQLADELDLRFGEPARDAELVVRVDATTAVRPSFVGTGVVRPDLRRALELLPSRVALRFGATEPIVMTEEAENARARVDTLLSGLRIVRFRGVDARLWPRKLASLIRTEPDRRGLRVALDPDALGAALRPRLGRFERAAADAVFVPQRNRVRITPSRPGLALDGERIGASLVKNLDATAHLARFTVSQPELTTKKARSLGIKEKISEFTTYHPCCAPRVSNIHLGAEILDGTIVLPGKRFSLNEALGKRTAERGFVSAPQIFNGRLEDAIGGGVSQIATTTFNAAFFAGVQIITHQPHQFYISRYPMGREATVSWGGPELIWRNDWPAAILVHVTTTATSITVSFYSSRLGRRVVTKSGAPCCYVSPRTITVRSSSLPAGTTNVVQAAGPSGFTISYTRKVFRKDKLRRNERYTWRYDAENAIIEVGPPARPRPKPTPKPQPDEPGGGEAPKDPGAGAGAAPKPS